MTEAATIDAPPARPGWRGRISGYVGTESVLLALGGVIGVLTGVLAFALIEVLRLVQTVAFGAAPGAVRIVAVPTLGALAVGLLVTYWSHEPSGGGIVEVLRTIALRGGRFRARVPFAVLFGSGLALGTGGAGGREAPIVLGGGAVGSIVGRFAGVDDDRMRTLVAAGAAAGIGASFNAPIGGMLFAIELLLGRLRAGSLQVIVLAAVAGSVTARELVGPEIVFQPAEIYSLRDPRELLGYALLGLLAALVGVAFLHGERIGHAVFARVKLWPPLRLALGGLGVGVIALAVPEVLGSGHLLPPIAGDMHPIQSMVDGSGGSGVSVVRFLLILLVAKFVATMLSVTSGNAVGSLMPTLFTGAALGGALGHLLEYLLPTSTIRPGAFALVGMAAVFAAAARTPLTAILIVFELTSDYGLVLPLMLGAGVATFVADRLAADGIYFAPLRQLGIAFREPEDVDVMQTITVGEVMTRDAPVIAADLPVAEARAEFDRTRHHGFAVVDAEDRLVGVVTQSDLAAAPPGGRDLVVADLMTRDPVSVTEGDPVFRGLQRMSALDVGRLPVVAQDDRDRLVGMLRRADVVHAYQLAVSRGQTAQQRADRARLRDLVGVQFVEVTIAAGSALDGAEVREVTWPPRSLITSVRRADEVVVPRGDSVLQAGDELVVATVADGVSTLRELAALPRSRSGG